jgi:MtN3 and saliva related transmembrane protein
MDSITILGLIGGTFTTASFFPQVLKTWKTRSTKDVSLGMFVLLSVGISFWIAYGIKIGSTPVVAANSVSLVLTLAMLGMKFLYK